MSEKTAKAKRKDEKKGQPEPEKIDLGNHLFNLTIGVYDSGKFTIDAPKGSSIPLALDCCIRACHQLWSLIVAKFSQPKEGPAIIPAKMADIDIISEIAKQRGGRA